MTTSRLQLLLQYYREDPLDPFNAYAVALEYLKSDKSEAQKYFDELLGKHPDYVPSYYHAAKFYYEMGNTEKAVSIYEKGIDTAKRFHDTKAARELKSALDELLF